MAWIGAGALFLMVARGGLPCEAFRPRGLATAAGGASQAPDEPLAAAVAPDPAGRSLVEVNQSEDLAAPKFYAFVVKDCGDRRLVGTYVEAGTKRGKPVYKKWSGPGGKGKAITLQWSDTRQAWRFFADNRFHLLRDTLYMSEEPRDTFPESGWVPVEGKAPAPVVVGLGGAAGDGPRRVLVAYASIGAGHKAAARAIQEQLKSDMPDAEVVLLDTVETGDVQFENGVSETVAPPRSFTTMNKHGFMETRRLAPAVTDALVDLMDEKGLWNMFKLPLLGDKHLKVGYDLAVKLNIVYGLERLESFILRHRWDLIISTHFFSSLILGSLRASSSLHVPAVTVITDFHAHKMWVADTDMYFVASDDVRETLLHDYGVPAAKVTVSGIPINPRIQLVTEAQAQAGVVSSGVALPSRASGGRLVLALPVSENNGDSLMVWYQLLSFARTHPEHAVIAVAGRKDDLRTTFLDSVVESLPENFVVLGFTRKLPEFMAVADLILSKPGGLTTSEALASGLPFLLMANLIIDVERPNAKVMLSYGAARSVDSPEDIPATLGTIFTNSTAQGAPIESMQSAARKLGRPSSAATVSGYVRGLFAAGELQEFAPGVCCCGETVFSSVLRVKKHHCKFMHAPQASADPLVAAELTQTECNFAWSLNHAATCPTFCGEFTYFKQEPIPAKLCSSHVPPLF